MALIGVTVVLNLINLAVFARRVVHQQHIVASQILVAPQLFVERLRCVGLNANHCARSVLHLPSEFLRWNAVSQCENAIDISKHFHLFGFKFLRLAALFCHLAQLHAVVAKLPFQLS